LGISILELVLRLLRQENFTADIAYPGQKYPVLTEPVAAVHLEKVDRANLTVTVEPIADETPKTVRAFVKATEKKGSYISVISALSNEHLRESLLQSALAELREFQKKYADLQELSEVFAAASALQARIA
jgi:hypothetical protein